MTLVLSTPILLRIITTILRLGTTSTNGMSGSIIRAFLMQCLPILTAGTTICTTTRGTMVATITPMLTIYTTMSAECTPTHLSILLLFTPTHTVCTTIQTSSVILTIWTATRTTIWSTPTPSTLTTTAHPTSTTLTSPVHITTTSQMTCSRTA